VSRAALVRRAALSAMVLVTAWSVWAWAQPAPAPARPGAPAMVGSGAPKPRRPAHAAAPRAAEEGKQEAEGEEAEGEGPAPMNWTEFGSKTPPFVAMLINFGVLAAAYYLLGKRGVVEGLQARRDHIAKDIEDAQRMKHEAEERAKVYQQKLATLEQEMRTARDSLVRAGEAEQERIVRDAEAKAERMRKDAEFLVEQEIKQIRGDLLREAVEAAVAAAESLLKARVTPADHERLAEDYLADLGRSKTAAAGGRSAS
jgi:F0F1-type ATP synthase membrane subunit b/b'